MCALFQVWETNSTLVNATAENAVCFHAAYSGVAGSQRCVYLAGLRAPQQPEVYRDGELVVPEGDIIAKAGNREDVGGRVGTPVALDVQTRARDEGLIEIGIRSIGEKLLAELPGQQWDGPTRCVATNSQALPCPGRLWTRRLMYSPTKTEIERSYVIEFQATNMGPIAAMFAPEPAPAGIACVMSEGVCPSTFGVPAFTKAFRVKVEQHVPRFMSFYNESTPLFTNEVAAVPVKPARYLTRSPQQLSDTLDPPPVVYGTIEGYINCPVLPFGLSAIKPGAALEDRDSALELSLTGPDAATLRALNLQVSETLLFRMLREPPPGVDNPPPADFEYFAHLSVRWDPPLEAAGRVYAVCIRAQDATSFAVQCVTIEIKRCFYCTLPHDTLHTVARAYHTNWLQIWSANYDRMGDDYRVRGAAWNETKNPNSLRAGTVLRLGPIYRTRFATTLRALARDFQTTEEALRLGNPDLDPDSAAVAAEREICVLPDVCTQENEPWV
jgi:hypothetical protein